MQLVFERIKEDSLKTNLVIVLFFALLVGTLRLFTFYISSQDWDESLYILVADQWLKGNLPYTVIWDNKPPGLYLLFLSAFKLFGTSFTSIRLLGCFFVTATCCFVYLIGKLFTRNGRWIGLLAGIFYALATLGNGGASVNAEILCNLFAAIAMYLLLSGLSNQYFAGDLTKKSYICLSLIGLSLGISLEIKQIALFDLVTVILILGVAILLRSRSLHNLTKLGKALLCLLMSFILPFLLFSAFFLFSGHFDDYIYANFTANKLRTIAQPFMPLRLVKAILNQIRFYPLFWLSVAILSVKLFIKKSDRWLTQRWLNYGFLLWLFVVLSCVSFVFRKVYYTHYFLQLLPALSLISAYVASEVFFANSQTNQERKKSYLALTAVLVILFIQQGGLASLTNSVQRIYFHHAKNVRNWQDTSGAIATYIESRTQPNDSIYVTDYQPIIYFLTQAKIPTRYAFPPFLVQFKDGSGMITGIDPLDELDSILKKRPVYIVKQKQEYFPWYADRNTLFFAKLNETLKQSYTLERSFEEVNLYRLN